MNNPEIADFVKMQMLATLGIVLFIHSPISPYHFPARCGGRGQNTFARVSHRISHLLMLAFLGCLP